MGLLVDGAWKDTWYETASSGGRFIRSESQFRDVITGDGGQYPAEPDRYHLYVAMACPWAHRALIMRALKGLENFVSVSVVHWLMLDKGWTFEDGPGVIPDTVNGARYLYEIYTRANPEYSGRVTIPLLWDKKLGRIVNNESSDIIRIFNSGFDSIGALPGDYYPEAKRLEIDAINERVYNTVNNGVYKAGFATTQEAYEEALYPLFDTLDWLDALLDGRQWLIGEDLTEADIRLFTTLIRFDAVYHGHFKCNLRRIIDYRNLSDYMTRFYKLPKISGTIDIDHIKKHYYESHSSINPSGIVPAGPSDPFGLGVGALRKA